MSGRLHLVASLALVGVLGMVEPALAETVAETSDQPAIPLPEPTPELFEQSGWLADRPTGNSVLAWHYNPSLVQPLLDVGAAVDEGPLPFRMRRMLATVVAARNLCRY